MAMCERPIGRGLREAEDHSVVADGLAWFRPHGLKHSRCDLARVGTHALALGTPALAHGTLALGLPGLAGVRRDGRSRPVLGGVLEGKTAELPELLPDLAYSMMLPYLGHEAAEREVQRLTSGPPDRAALTEPAPA
jgi:hypothetical protein